MWPEITVGEWEQPAAPNPAELRAARRALSALSGDRDVRGWEYLQSFRDRGRWVHGFRHRHHPVKRQCWYLLVPASEGWSPYTVH